MKSVHTTTTTKTTTRAPRGDDTMTRDSFGTSERSGPGDAGRKAAGAAGRAVGAMAGAVGAAAGSVAGAASGAARKMRQRVDATAEDRYWAQQYRHEPYYDTALSYEDYAPAYRLGYGAYERYPGEDFDRIAGRLETDYERERGGQLGWERARDAARAAWRRVAEGAERVMPGDRDRDGR